MVRKVWVCFDEDDNIINVCDGCPDPDCLSKDCELYIMKLIPVKRSFSELEKEVDKVKKKAKELDDVAKGFERSSRRLKRSLDRFKI